ncbi:MAG: hypothetical protein KAR31_11720 [Candidatus Omnitrophica bacterium]|nr:hypothetical protein [Candidatus Omnitrophota bacterium]MCK5083567.1 hypothetical protein [Candidatus Omnitrophota bacterium]
MLCIIGNSPSSGSTLLADLLDSTNVSACGNELNLFSNKNIYNFTEFKKNIRRSSATFSVGRIRNTINVHRLYGYGLNEKEFVEFIKSSENLPESSGNSLTISLPCSANLQTGPSSKKRRKISAVSKNLQTGP